MEFFKNEPEEPPNEEEIEYYKPENLQNRLVGSGVSYVNSSPPKAAKKRKKPRRLFSVPKRRNKKKNDPSVSVEPNIDLASVENPFSNVSKDVKSNASSDTVILSDENSNLSKSTSNNLEFPLLHEILTVSTPLVNVSGSPKSRKRKGKKGASRAKKPTKNGSLSSELPLPPETFVAYSTENQNDLTNSLSKLPNSNVAGPSKGLPINFSGADMLLDSVPGLDVKRKVPVKRSKPQSPRSRKKQNNTVKAPDYSSLEETINFVATRYIDNQDIDNLPIEKPLKKTARKKTGGKLTTLDVLKRSAPYYDNIMSESRNPLPAVESAGKISLLPSSTSISQGASYPMAKSSKRFCVSRATSEDLPPHVNLTFEEDVSEKQNFPQDISHFLRIDENPLLNLNRIDSNSRLKTPTNSEKFTSKTSDCSKVNSSSLNTLENSDSNSSVSFLSNNYLRGNIMTEVPATQVKIKTEIAENPSESDLPPVSQDSTVPLNIKKEIVETNVIEPTCSLTKAFNTCDKVPEHLEHSQRTIESAFTNAIGSFPIKSELVSVPGSQVLNTVPTPSPVLTSLSSNVIEKDPENSFNQVNSNRTLTHESEVRILTAEEKEKLKEKEIEVICLDDSSSDSISFVASESNVSVPQTVTGGPVFNLNTQLELPKNNGITIKTEIPPLTLVSSQPSVPNSRVAASKDNSLPMHIPSTPSNGDFTSVETSINTGTSGIRKDPIPLAVDSQALGLNVVNIKKEIDEQSNCVVIEGSSKSNSSPQVGPMTATNESCASTCLSSLSSIDRSIESVIQSGKVSETIIEHPLDLLQSIKKEVFEDCDIDLTESIRHSSTPVPEKVNDLISNNDAANTSQSIDKRGMLAFLSGTGRDDLETTTAIPNCNFSLESEEASRTSIANKSIENNIEPEKNSESSSKNKSSSFDSSIDISKTVAGKDGRSGIEEIRTNISSNISNFERTFENILGSGRNCDFDSTATSENADNVSSRGMSVLLSEQDNDSKCSFSSATSCSVSENQCLTNRIGEKENSPAYDFDFAECVSKYIRKIRNETENSKPTDEISKETDGSTDLKDNQYSEEIDEKVVEETGYSPLLPPKDLKTDFPHDVLNEQGSQDSFHVLNSLEKLRLNMDRYFKNKVPSYLIELYEEEKMLQNREKRCSHEIFPYDVVASNLRAAAERSLNSIKKGDEMELKDFPVVEEEIECYYRLLNVEPRLISTSGVDDKNLYCETKTAECPSDIEVKITCEIKDETENRSASKTVDLVTSEKLKAVVEEPSTPYNLEKTPDNNEVEIIEVIDDDGPEVEKSVLAPTSKPVLDSNSIVSEENSKDASQSAGAPGKGFSLFVLENIKKEKRDSQQNIDAELEVDLELRQLACDSMKSLSSAETENSNLMDFNFMNKVPISSQGNVGETLPTNLSEKIVHSQDKETPLPTKPDKEAEILLVDLSSPVPSPKAIDGEDKTVSNDVIEEVTCNEDVINISSEIESEDINNKAESKSPQLNDIIEKEPQQDASAVVCDSLPQEQSRENSESSQAQSDFPAIDMSVTDLLSILLTAKSLPSEPLQSGGEVKFIQSYDYGHGIQQKTRERQNTYSEPAFCSMGRDFFPPDPPSVQFEIVHEYGHKPPTDSIGESAEQNRQKEVHDSGKGDEATACEEDGSEDEFYTVESEIICNSDAEDEDRDTTEPDKTVKSTEEKSTEKTTEEKSTDDEVKDFPQYKSRWERIMERKESEKEIAPLMPLKPLSEKPIKKPVALVQPRSQTVTPPKAASFKDSYKLLSAKANVVTHKKKHKKGKDTKIKSGAKVKHASPNIKNKRRSAKRDADDASLLFTPDKASKPKKKGLLPTPPLYKRMGEKDSESKRLYGRVINRGGFLTESSSDTKQAVKTPKPKKVHEKRKQRMEGKGTEDIHSMINLPIDHIPVSKVLDPRANLSKPRFSLSSFGKPTAYFKPLCPNPPDTFSDLSSSQCRSPLLSVPPTRIKTPLLPDPLGQDPSRVPLLPSPLSFDKLLTKTLTSVANSRRSWPNSHFPSTSSETKRDDIYSPSRSLSPPSISSDSPVSSGGDSPASGILPLPTPPPVPVVVAQPPPNRHHRTRNTGCICLPPKTLKPLVGNSVFETFNVLLLILEWNVDWLVQQQKNPEPPPISNTIHKVKSEYSTFEEYYNSYLPLVLLETWQRIYVSWTHLHQAPPYFCQVASYEVQKHSTKVKCQVIFNYVERDKGIFPEEGNIIMVKFGTKDKGGIKILGYLTDVEVDTYNVSDSNQRGLARLVKSTSADHLQLLTMTFIGAYTSDDFDINQLVRIHVLCNIKSILKQNDALLYAKKSPLFGNILNPISDGLRTVSMVTRNSDPHKVALNVSECVKEIIQGIVTMHPIPLLTIVKSVPSSDKLLVLPPLIEKMKDSYKTKVLYCTRTSKALADIGFNLESCSAKVVIIGKRADVHQKLRKYMVDDLASNRVYEAHAKTKNGVPFLEDSIKSDVLQKAKMDVLHDSDVILTLVRYCHDDLIVQLCEDGDFVPRLCCIVDEANLCTEPEILIPLLYGISKLILIGDPDVPSKVCSKTAAKFHFNKSLFHRAYELDAMNE